MSKLSEFFTLGFVLALICLPPLDAQTVTNAPVGANAAAASPAPTAQAPDEVTNKISELVHDGKYAEAQGLTTGLLLRVSQLHAVLRSNAFKQLRSPKDSKK